MTMKAVAVQSTSDSALARKHHKATERSSAVAPSPFQTSSPDQPLVQRKSGCACGGGCPRCQQKPLFQAKLAVSEPGDVFEREADQVADQIMRLPAPTLQRSCAACSAGGSMCPGCDEEKSQLVQRKIERNADGSSSAPDGLLHELGPGHPLDFATRSFFESRFGRDFGDVRVHTDAKAAESASAVNALAYTVGRNVVFAGGQYSPQAASGQRLLAHELTHVVQQTGAVCGSRQRGQAVENPSAPARASPEKSHAPPNVSLVSVRHNSSGLRLSRTNNAQTATVLSRGAVAGVQFILNGTMNSTRVGPVSGQEDVSVIIGRLTTIRSLAQQLLPLWNTATPFTPPGAAAPNPLTPLTVDELARGLLVFNRYRLAIPPAARPPVMTEWKLGMRFSLPILIDTATNEGVLHPDPIRSMAGTFDAAWGPLLTQLPATLPAQPAADLRQAATDFLTSQPTTLARGIHLGARAVANAQESREFILEVFNQVGAGAFELALAFMDNVVNSDIGILAPQAAGAAILNRIRALLAALPPGVTPTQQSSLTRANLMLGRVAGVPALPETCIPNRKLTWSNFPAAVRAGAPANREAETHFEINQVAFQGTQMFQATMLQALSWVRPRSRDPGNLAVNGCQAEITRCETFFNGIPAGVVGSTWDTSGAPSATCPAAVVPRASSASTFGECTTVIGTACTAARVADSPRLLRHEQLHFDIPCVLANKANAARASGAAVSLATVRTRANTLTAQYDAPAQSDHGCNAGPQARWEGDVALGLPGQTFP